MRFSLKTLLLVFTVVAVSIAGLLYANLAWAAFFYTAAFLLVLTGIVGALVPRGPGRPFWIGFALFGAGYFGLALVGENSLARFASDLRQAPQPPKLATTQLLMWAEPYLRPDMGPDRGLGRARGSRARMFIGSGGLAYFPTTPTEHFIEVGHSIFTLILALVGGWIGSRFSREPPAAAEPASGQK